MLIICALILTIAGCANDKQVTSDTLKVRAATTVLEIEPSTNQVEDFLNKKVDFKIKSDNKRIASIVSEKGNIKLSY